MNRSYTVLFALVATYLVVSAVPVAVADSTNIAIASEHDTASELQSGTFQGAVSVEGSGESAEVVFSGSSEKLIEGAEDGDLSEYEGNTGQFTPTGEAARSGDYGLGHASEQYSYDIYSHSGLADYPEQGDSFSYKIYFDSVETYYHNFYFAVQNGSNGQNYGIRTDLTNDRIVFSTDGNEEASANAAIPVDTWLKMSVDWSQDGSMVITLTNDETGNQIQQFSVTPSESYQSGGIGWGHNDVSSPFGEGSGVDIYTDDLVIGTGSNSGTYLSDTYNVDNPSEGVVELTEVTDANATVTWQAKESGVWTNVSSTTYSTAGTKTADLSGVSGSEVRVRIDFTTSSAGTVRVDRDTVKFRNHDPEIDEASASPQANEDLGSADVELSVPISDAEFGSAQGDSVTVDFYADGQQIDSQTITSNQTVSTVAQDLGPGNHTWHVETTDSYGGNATSSTFSFDVNHYAASTNDSAADPKGGEQFNDENLQVSIPVNDTDFADSTGDNVTVDLYVDGTQTTSTSITSNQTVSFNVSDLADGSHSWHVETSDSYSLTSSSSTFSFEVNHYAAVPDNANVTPSDGAQKTTRTVTFSVPVNDTDFAETSGDEVQATFYLDGSEFATENITANGTVSASTTISTGGSHSWHVELVDEYGNTNETDADSSTSTNEAFTIYSPSELRIYNESAPNTLVDEVTVNIQFYGGQDGDAFTVQRTTSDGTINMSGLPADQEFIVVVDSEGYYNRRIYVGSLYEQANVYLLPTSTTAVYNIFKIDDKSGAYSPGETRIIIQRALNRSGNFTWQTVSGDFFGSTNEHKTNLRYNVRYRLIVENDEGDRRMMGPYFATDENNPKIISVSSIVVSPPEGQQYYATAWVNSEDPAPDNNVTERTLRVTYSDPQNQTDSLDLVIHERGNESNVLADVTVDDVGTSYAYTYTLTGENATEKAWVANWSAERNGATVGQAIPVGNRGKLPLPMDSEWLARFALVALPIVGALASERIATLGAMGVVAFAGVLMLTGIWEIPVLLWFAALITAVGAHALTMSRRGSVFG